MIRSRLAFTLIELLIVIAVIAILATVLLGANIQSSLQKARDTTRKQDLNKLARIFEDYYNDHAGYPTNDPATGFVLNLPWGSDMPNYPIVLPKDPLSPTQQYYYETDPVNQNYYALFARLENTSDDAITTTGCQNGCGPNLSFNYVVFSPNVTIIAGVPSGNTVGYPGYGVPTATPGGPSPTPAGPTPTLNPIPPSDPDGICALNQCCAGHWCGVGSYAEGGDNCTNDRKCSWNEYDGWNCEYAPSEC